MIRYLYKEISTNNNFYSVISQTEKMVASSKLGKYSMSVWEFEAGSDLNAGWITLVEKYNEL